MIIPIKCFTCGTVIADKYRYFQEEVAKVRKSSEPIYFSETNTEKTVEGKVLDHLRLTKPCCRRHMLTHVDIE